jgi:6-phosphogluconate dehydrogenase
MELGMIGLGRMGSNMVIRLLEGGHDLMVYDPRPEAAEPLVEKGAVAASSLKDLVEKLTPPRTVWVMVPAGEPTESTVNNLSGLLSEGDVVIEGGNSFFKDSIRLAQMVGEKGIAFLDVGTSGGIWGLEEGYSMTIGGDEEVFERLEPIFETLAPEQGYGYVGPSGAGHFVKMVHNGMEYALLETYSEGFELLREGPYEDLDLGKIAGIWNHGGVIRSWLLELAEAALNREGDLGDIAAEVGGGETGRWALETALENEVPFNMLSEALFQRYRSRRESFAARMVAALRKEFGGHPTTKK